MGAVWTIVVKDLRLRLRDRTLLLYGLVAPLALATVLAGVFGGIEERVAFELGLVAEDGDVLAAGFVDEVLPALEAEGLVTVVVRHDDREELRGAVEAGEQPVGIVFPGSTSGANAQIEVVGSVDAPTASGVAEAIVVAYGREAATIETVVQVGVAAGRTDVDRLVAAVRDAAPSVALRDEPVGAVPLDVTTYTAAGISIFFLLFSVGLAVTALLEEERDGTMARLVTAPIPRWVPLAAKSVSAFLVGVVSMLVLAAATTALVGADWGDPLLLVGLVVAAVLAAVGVVGLVASLARTPEAASSMLGVVGTALGALGGSFFPLPGGGVLGAVAAVTPHRWFLRGMTRLAGGGGAGDLAGPVAVLLLIAVVTGGLAVVRFRRRAEA